MISDSDSARDLFDDLALCDGAQPGPWQHINMPDCRLQGVCLGHSLGEVIASKDFYSDEHPQEAEKRHAANMKFIAAAREGWPAAIRRAMAAEEALRQVMSTAPHYVAGLSGEDDSEEDDHRELTMLGEGCPNG